MEQLEFFKIPSPCVCVCEMNERGYCKGCLRSRDERLYWLKFSDAQKKQVLRLCQQRRYKLWLAQQQAQKKSDVAMDATAWLFETEETETK